MNDNQLSIAGNMVGDPTVREVAGGRAMATFRIASTPRRFDATKGEWQNGEALFLDVICWNRLADRVGRCLRKGDPVTLAGRLRMRTYEVDGRSRHSYEMEAQHVSPDLNRVEVGLQRVDRSFRQQPAPVAGPLVPLVPLVPQMAEPAA